MDDLPDLIHPDENGPVALTHHPTHMTLTHHPTLMTLTHHPTHPSTHPPIFTCHLIHKHKTILKRGSEGREGQKPTDAKREGEGRSSQPPP